MKFTKLTVLALTAALFTASVFSPAYAKSHSHSSDSGSHTHTASGRDSSSDQSTSSDPYWKKDADAAASSLPSKYRTSEDSFSSDASGDLPSREGMDTLRISGSGQFGTAAFSAMTADLRNRTDGTICVFDLRQETHGFADGTPISFYADHNAANKGMGTAAVLELEKQELNALSGTELTLRSGKSKKKKKSADDADESASTQTSDSQESGTKDTGSQTSILQVTAVQTEEELCAAQNVRYVRIACTDHVCPEASSVDEFMKAYLSLPENTWLHFHCAAGVGRTGLFMMMADMLRNPDVPLETIVRRQVLLGANDPWDSDESEKEESAEKQALLENFHSYVLQCGQENYRTSFTSWMNSGLN